MERINTASKAEDLFGPGRHGFKNGDLGLGVSPTDLNAEWFNQVQEELLSVVEAAGVVPGPASTQLRQAIKRMFGGNVKLLTNAGSPHALTVDDAGMVLINAAAGNVIVNLPAANVLAGLGFRFRRIDTATGNSVTVNRAGADTIDEGATSFTISSKAMRTIQADGATTWSSVVASGFVTAAEAQGFANTDKAISPATLASAFQGGNQQLAASGYQKLPGGLIVQWGNATPAVVPGTLVTWPLAFPTAVRAVVSGGNSGAYSYTGSETINNMRLISASGGGVFWIAVGH